MIAGTSSTNTVAASTTAMPTTNTNIIAATTATGATSSAIAVDIGIRAAAAIHSTSQSLGSVSGVNVCLERVRAILMWSPMSANRPEYG